MKTEREADSIQRFCLDFSAALSNAGAKTYLSYDNETEYVTGTVNGINVDISVYADNVEAASRDIVRGINRVLEEV